MAHKKFTKEQMKKCRILLPEFRVSHPHLFVAQAVRNGKPKFSITALLKKQNEEGEDLDLSGVDEDGNPRTLLQVIKQAKVNYYGADKSNWPEEIVNPIKDGDSKKYQKPGEEKEGYAGHWVVKATANADRQPGLVDAQLKPITDPAKFYPGCFARAWFYAYVYEVEGNIGVGFIVDHVQKTNEGKSLSSRKATSQMFTPVKAAAGKFDDSDDEEIDVDSYSF